MIRLMKISLFNKPQKTTRYIYIAVQKSTSKKIGYRCAQTASSAVGPMAFYDSDTYDPKNSSPNTSKYIFSTTTSRANLDDILQHTFQIANVQSNLRDHLHKMSKEMNERVYFYNERNPHLGMIMNIKEVLYNYFQLVGPVKDAWYKVLINDQILVDLIIHHIRNIEKNCATHGMRADDTAAQPLSVVDVVMLVESLENKVGVSCLKFSQAVRQGNVMQFKINALNKRELVILQVLAQYAFYGYELV